MRKIVAVLGILLAASCPTAAGPFEDATSAYERGDYTTAARLLRLQADQGNANAQLFLGFLYENGEGVRQDYVQAADWYRRAAEQGDARAQFSLGLLYDNARGMPEDYVEALKWYLKSAEQGDVVAQMKVGIMYENGRGIQRNNVQALKWYIIASSQEFSPWEKAARDEVTGGRERVAAKMSAAQVAEAQKIAREWKPTKQQPR